MRIRAGSGFTTIRTEGGLVPAELLARVSAGDPELERIDPAAYHLAAGERRNEAVNRSWSRLTGAWAAFRTELDALPEGDHATTLTRRRWLLVVFQELGYGQLQTTPALEADGRSFPVSHLWQHVPIHLVGANVDLDHRTRGVAGAARVSPHGLVQELLNASDDHLWGFVANGRRLRLLRDNASLTRPAFVEFDLEAMFDGQVYTDFVVLWLLAHESRLEGDPPEKCVLEAWIADAARRGTRALDQLRDGVQTAIEALGTGFLAQRDNAALREALRSGSLTTQDYYRQLLRLVYRLLFLFVAEDRDLLLRPDADATTRARYQRFYSTARLRALAARRRGTTHDDLWAGLRLVMAALGADHGEPALGLPGLGSFLWSQRATPDLDTARCANDALLAALRALTTVRDGNVTRTVDYRNLGSEELGGIYESLLELHPELNADTAAFNLLVAAGNERKTTGSYYTPTSLINELLDSALDPVLTDAAAAPDPESAILALTVLDPACGSGHFLIAAAHRIAQRLATVRSGDDEPSPAAVRAALRDVVGRCIHGIDINEMAVELCKVSLWMEAMEPGKPLSFLEHRIVCGNSLLGATPRLLADGIPDTAFKPLTGDDKAVVRNLKARNAKERGGQTFFSVGPGVADLARPVSEGIARIDAVPDGDIDGLHEKERLWRDLQRSDDTQRAKLVADAWCAAFVAPKASGAAVITDGIIGRLADDPGAVEADVITEVSRLASEYRFLHFHLAFPDVFTVPVGTAENEKTGWDGGFDVVLGNPPWERVKLQEKEFFAPRHPEIAEAPNAAARKRLIADLEHEDPALFEAYRRALRKSEGESHLLRNSGRFPLAGRGDVNTYAVFAEAFRDAVGPRGRCGVILPTGIATDDTTKHYFSDTVERRSLVSLFDFENRLRIFPAVDSRVKFCLLTLSGLAAPVDEAEFVFFAYSTADLADPERRFTLTPDDFALINPNTRTCPVFRTRRDAELTKSIYRRVPVLVREGDPDGNPWGIQFSTMFHMSNDSGLFRTADQLEALGARLDGNTWTKGEERWLPLYEGKMVHHFNHRWSDADGDTLTDTDLADPTRLAQPRYWVAEPDVRAVLKHGREPWILGWRNITNTTNERTLVSFGYPVAAANNSMLLIHGPKIRGHLYATLSAFAVDYVARQKLGGTNFTYNYFRQLPLLAPRSFESRTPWDADATVASWCRPRIAELAYTAWDLVGFADDLGATGPPFCWDPARRVLLRAELDACFFHLYGIERDGVDYIMDTFPIVKRKDEAAHGEYRTKRLILERYDAMAKAAETGEPYQTILDPPPAHDSLRHPESTRPPWAKP